MRGSSTTVKAYGAISPWIRGKFRYIGRIRMSNINGKIATYDKHVGAIGSGDDGGTGVFTPTKCLISHEYGRLKA